MHRQRQSLVAGAPFRIALGITLLEVFLVILLCATTARAELLAFGPPRHRFGIGGTASLGTAGKVGSLHGGFEAWYQPNRVMAFGIDVASFYADNGADPQYCFSCARTGKMARGFVEGRFFSESMVSGYARLSTGVASVLINGDDLNRPQRTKVGPVFAVSVGPQLTLWHIFFRLRGGANAAPGGGFLEYGADLGAVF